VKQWLKRDQGVEIEKFVVTAVKMPGVYDESGTKQLIHWRGCGAYSIDTTYRSTSFDTRKLSNQDPAIEVQLISKAFAVSSTAAASWETKLIKKCTTTDIYNLLVAKKFNHYRYNGNGSGCLTWTTALVECLEGEGIIQQGSTAEFKKKIMEVRGNPAYWVPLEPGAEFY